MPPATRRRVAGWLVVALLTAAAACGSEPSAEEERQRLADDLVAEVGDRLGREEAECVAGRLQEAYGDDAFDEVLEAAERRSGEDADAVRGTVIDIFAACDALEAVATTDG